MPKLHIKDRIFSEWSRRDWISTCRRMKRDPSLSAHIQIHPKWSKALNVKPEALKLLDERMGNTHKDASSGKDFLNKDPSSPGNRINTEEVGLCVFQSFSDKRKLLIDWRGSLENGGRQSLALYVCQKMYLEYTNNFFFKWSTKRTIGIEQNSQKKKTTNG